MKFLLAMRHLAIEMSRKFTVAAAARPFRPVALRRLAAAACLLVRVLRIEARRARRGRRVHVDAGNGARVQVVRSGGTSRLLRKQTYSIQYAQKLPQITTKKGVTITPFLRRHYNALFGLTIN